MHGDFSRRPTDVARNDNGVLYQQGRVFLDADGNAQTHITNAWQDTAGMDIIGAGVAAVPGDQPDGLRVDAANLAGNVVTLTVQPGRVWADGLLWWLDGDGPVQRTATYLQPPVQDPAADPSTIAAGVRDAVILELWREAINGFQVPQRLIEPALGGPDTTERVHTAAAFRLLRLAPGDTCDNLAGKLADDPSKKGKLTVTLQPTSVIAGDCPVVEGGGYTGFEHNLYRIEIAQTNGGPTRFKWSQFNGGLVGRATFNGATLRAAITANLQAITSSGLTSFYLEAWEEDPALGHWRLTYGAEVTLNNDELVLPAAPTFGAVPSSSAPVFIRLWNGIRAISDFPVSANPTELVDGIRLEFEADGSGKYVPGDYWTFSVRAGEIGNEETLVDAAPPEGIRYHRVPLAILNWDGSDDLTAAEGTIHDCRRVFQPLTRLSTCCTFRVGDGIRSFGDFTSIQEAIDHLPPEGGEICVLPGTYNENVLIEGRSNVTLSACDTRSRIVAPAPPDQTAEASPAIHVRNSSGICIRNLAVEAHQTGVGILLEGDSPTGGGPAPLRDIVLEGLEVTAATRSAIEVREGAGVIIRGCSLLMHDVASAWPALFFLGDDGLIEGNTVMVRPEQQPARLPDGIVVASAGLGGIQLAGTCDRVRVVDNLVQGGIGNGVTLGSIVLVDAEGNETPLRVGWVINVYDPCNPCKPGDILIPNPPADGGDEAPPRQVSAGPLRDIVIERNRILDMGLNGIGVVGFFDPDVATEMVSVEGLTIVGNIIKRCLWRELAPISDAMQDSMGYGGIALADVEHLVVQDNVIEDNGPDHLEPICGIFVLHGEGIDISRNRIVNNGVKTGEPSHAAKVGRRGGIRIIMAVPPTVPAIMGRQEVPVPNGVPAVRVHDNIVSQPLGRALSINGMGPMSIQNNQLTSRGVSLRTNPISDSFAAGTVMIMNMGTAQDLAQTFRNFATLLEGGKGLRCPFQVDNTGIRLTSIDTFTTYQPASSYRLANYESIRTAGTSRLNRIPINVENVGATGAAAREPIEGSTSMSAVEARAANPQLVSENVLFANNQCTLDLAETGLGIAISSVAIWSIDDVGFHGNQCECLLMDDVVITNALLFGLTIRVSDNRFKETLGRAIFSGLTIGLMNATTNNQSNHCLLVIGLVPALRIDSGNASFISWLCPEMCALSTRGLVGAGFMLGDKV